MPKQETLTGADVGIQAPAALLPELTGADAGIRPPAALIPDGADVDIQPPAAPELTGAAARIRPPSDDPGPSSPKTPPLLSSPVPDPIGSP